MSDNENPQSFFNGYLSAMRNSIISVSLGVAIYGFSRSFAKQRSKDIMKKVSIVLYLFSLMLILNTVILLRNYLNSVNKDDIEKLPKYVDLSKWRLYEYIGWFLSVIVTIIILLSSSKYIKNVFL